MGKKDKSRKDKSQKWEKKLQELESEMTENRKKMSKLLGKMARMDVNDYVLKNREGQDVKLSDLFEGKDDLVLIHNMGKTCSYCTMWADGFNGIYNYVQNRAGFALVSPDPPEVQREFADERGWRFPMFSAQDSTFISDMGYRTESGEYWPGASAFHKDNEGNITRVSKAYFGPGDYYCSVWHFFDMLHEPEVQEE